MKIIELEQGSQEWKAYRHGKVGGSDIPVIAGARGAYRTYKDLLQEKITGIEPNFSDFTLKLFADGHEWEGIVRQTLSEAGVGDFIPCVVESEENEKFFCSTDGVCGDTLLEVKYTTSKKIADQVFAGEVPEVYDAQIQWNLFVTGLKKALLCVVYNGEMIQLHVTKNEWMITQLKRAAELFIDQVELGIVPKVELMTPQMLEIADLKSEAKYLKALSDKLEDRAKDIAEKVLRDNGSDHISGMGVTIQTVEKIGNIQYDKIPELKNVNLELYRKKPTSYLKITVTTNNQKEVEDGSQRAIADSSASE